MSGPVVNSIFATCESGICAPPGVATSTCGQRGGVVAILARVAHLHAVALAALDRARHGRAADRGLDHRVHVLDREAEARRRRRGRRGSRGSRPPVVRSANTLRVPGTSCERVRDLDGGRLDAREVVAEHLDAERAAHAGREHLGARLDRHPPQVRHAGEDQRLVQLGDQPVPGEPLAPALARRERHHGLDHRERRRIGGRLGAPDLAEDALDLREALQLAVHQLEHARRPR